MTHRCDKCHTPHAEDRLVVIEMEGFTWESNEIWDTFTVCERCAKDIIKYIKP